MITFRQTTAFLLLSAAFLAAPQGRAQSPKPAGSPGPPVFAPAKVPLTNESVARHIVYPKEMVVAKKQSAVQFYCDIDGEGRVTTTFGLIGNDQAFKTAVQNGLDWGRFEPARINGKGVPMYVAGTVLFFRQNDIPIVAILLATHDRARVGKIAQYTQPQLIGGLRPYLENGLRQTDVDNPYGATAEVLVKVTAEGKIESMSITAESPKGSRVGEFVMTALKAARFTPAYADLKPEAGAINVIANFSEM